MPRPALMTRRSRAALFILALGLPAAALASGSPEAWFGRMQHTLQGQSYQGTIVYMGTGQPMAYHVVVCAAGYARLSALSGPPREIVRGPRVAVRLRPDGSSFVVHGMAGSASPLPFPPATDAPIPQLKHVYRFELGGWSRVAGHKSRLVELVPRDGWRYGYRVWISDDTGLPLRSELVSGHGKVLERSFFTTVQPIDAATARTDIGPKAMSLVRHAASGPTLASSTACPGEAHGGHLKLTELPPGFHRVHTSCEAGPGNRAPVTHVVLSDGVSTVSVFVARRRDNGGSLVGGTSIGSIHAVGRVERGFAVTAMGAVPFATVSSIAHGVKVSAPRAQAVGTH